MYKRPNFYNTRMKSNTSIPAESIERMLERWLTNKEKIEGNAPLIYTERAKGVIPSTNIRTDRFEIAIEATEKIAKSYKARREERHLKVVKDDGEAKPIQGKEDKTSTGS